MVNFNLLDAFVKVDLRKENGEEYNLQGILFRDNSDFGIILPVIEDIEEGLELITINSPLYPREFEFTPTKDFIAVKNDFLMFVPIEEIECKEEFKHRTRVYQKKELSCIRYTMKPHFEYRNNWQSSYIATYMNRLTKGVLCNNCFGFMGYTHQEDAQNDYLFVNTLDAKLYDGSPLIVNTPNIYPNEVIYGIFIKNPESIPELKDMPNMGIIVNFNVVNDLIIRL